MRFSEWAAQHRKGMMRVFFIMVLLTLVSGIVYSCSYWLRTQGDTYIRMDEVELIQLEEPAADAPAMIMHTSCGNILAVLYPDEAPAYVAQFTKLVQDGYYNDSYIYKVENGVYFEAGSPNADGTLTAGTDATYERVPTELSANLWPFKGAFCVPSTMTDGSFLDRVKGTMHTYCGTRFAVCNSIVFDEETKKQLEAAGEPAQALTDAFLTHGGIPNYAQQMTIFAQAYGDSSLAVIDQITAAEVDEQNAPAAPIHIEKIELGTYGELAAQAEQEETA